MVEDGSNYVNDSFYFTTEGYDANIQSDGGLGIGIVGVIGLLGLVFYLVKRRRDKNA